jgi:hypothetical protein
LVYDDVLNKNKNMNYQQVYDNIIQKAKSKNRVRFKKKDLGYVYYENHHIIPKCIGGIDEKENKVLLTAREHFVCHKLLTYIYPNNRKLACAFHYICFNNKANRKLSSRDYARAVELMRAIPVLQSSKDKARESMKGKNVGRIQSEETKKLRALANTGKTRTQETKDKTRKSLLGKTFSEERKNNISKGHLGQTPWNKGKPTWSGKKNPMYGTTTYDLWVKKYGKEEADKRKEARRIKLSKSNIGKHNKKIEESFYPRLKETID